MVPTAELPVLTPCNLSKQRIEQIAARIRDEVVNKVGYQDGDDLRRLVEQLGGRIEYRSTLDWDRSDGSIEVYGPRRFLIRLPQETTVRRDRFTTAHELAHYFLHTNQGQLPGKATRSGSAERVEWEANWFAGEFLMPADAFRTACEELGGDLRQVAERFGVSVDAARVRRDVLRLG